MSPTKAATESLAGAVESLPNSLHPILLHYGTKIIECRSKLFNKQNMKKKLEDEPAYIPKSARATAFKVTLSKKAAESDRGDFLEQMAAQAKETYEQSLRDVVEECIQLEIAALESTEKETTADLLHGLAIATSTHAGIDCNPHLRVANLIKLDKNLFKYTPGANIPTGIKDMYEAHHTTDLPATTIVMAHTNYPDVETAAQQQQAAAASFQLPENHGIQTLRKAIESILILPTRAFCAQHEENQRTIALKKMATDLIDGKATEAAAMELDAEGGASYEQLQDLIRKESAKREKKYDELQKKCARLESVVESLSDNKSSKNDQPRGRQGASSKKKSGNNSKKNNAKPKNSETNNTNRNTNAEAAANNNASGSGRSASRGRGSKKQSAPKRNKSRTRSNRQKRG